MKSYCQKSLPSFIFVLLLFAVFTAEPTTAPTTDLKASDVTYHIINSSGTGDQLQAKCKTFGLRGARINDSFSLAEAQKSLSDSRKYWTGLSWHPTLLYTYYWYQDKSLRTTVENGLLLNHAWFCFLANKYQSKLQIDYCNAKHPFICENNYSVNGEALSYHTISENISGFGVERHCGMTGRGARINDSKSLNKVIGQIKDNQTYWTALSMTRSRAFLWNRTLDTIVNTDIISMDRWLCFFVSNDSHKLLGEWCEKSHKYLCEPAVAVTTEAAQSTAAPTTNEITPTATVLGKVKPSKATDVVQRAIAEIKALNATEEGSLMNAVDAITKLLKFLEKEVEQVKNDGIDVLIATRELEFFVINYGKINFKENESRIIYNEHFAMKIEKVPTGSKAGVVFSLNEIKNSSKEDGESISIPPKAFDFKDAIVVCIIYDDIKQWIPGDKGIQLHNNSKTLKNLKLGSRIIAASVSPEPSGTLQENVTISFRPDNEFKKEDIPHCRFWDHSSLNGSWSSRGCSLVKSVNNEITCTCNHLTNFAVLMQVSASKEVSAKHSLALKVITYIGCALSLTGEVLTVIAYCVLMNLKQEQIQIRFNLVVAIAIAQIAFLSGIDATGSKDVCVFVAALIHFFYLAGFAWMLFEGVHLYLMVVKVFNIVVRMRVFYAVAWGVPALIVALSIVIASSQDNGVHSYVHADLCWVSFNNNLIWTFVAPVLLVCLANSVLLGLVVHEILKMQSHNTSETEKLRQGTKAFLVLFPLLGMTWVFGVLSVTDAGLVFQYVFTILNSLQGFLIFMLHVVRNGDVRAEFRRQKRMWKDARSINASLCLPQDQGNTWTNKAVKSNAHELESKCNEAATCENTSAGYDNALAFYEEKCITPVNM